MQVTHAFDEPRLFRLRENLKIPKLCLMQGSRWRMLWYLWCISVAYSNLFQINIFRRAHHSLWLAFSGTHSLCFRNLNYFPTHFWRVKYLKVINLNILVYQIFIVTGWLLSSVIWSWGCVWCYCSITFNIITHVLHFSGITQLYWCTDVWTPEKWKGISLSSRTHKAASLCRGLKSRMQFFHGEGSDKFFRLKFLFRGQWYFGQNPTTTIFDKICWSKIWKPFLCNAVILLIFMHWNSHFGVCKAEAFRNAWSPPPTPVLMLVASVSEKQNLMLQHRTRRVGW